ncbi:MAG: FKBP-type peptidyl-prolyl cis-trans isomerase [Pirellulaceae bacterium]|jgi:FKBP-type peptidyl-prolyl cis-trans isomerase 2|nr:FKBP-type peptidyl-prolyl cis-trans isomerase [Pirellulaceae bacterium]
MYQVQVGDRVRVRYVRERNGTPECVTSTPPKEIEFVAGGANVLPGLSAGVIGMVQGESRRLTLEPSDAYGPVKPNLVKEIPRAQFPKRITLRVGKRLSALSTMSGRRRQVRVVEINTKSVLVDGNHALAGQIVKLEVLLISVDSSSEANRSQPQFDTGGEG